MDRVGLPQKQEYFLQVNTQTENSAMPTRRTLLSDLFFYFSNTFKRKFNLTIY